MCSDTERLDILIVLHICLSPTSYDSSNISLGNIRLLYRTISPRGGSRIAAISKMEYFGIIVDGFQPLLLSQRAPS